jgi:hypothetical protein
MKFPHWNALTVPLSTVGILNAEWKSESDFGGERIVEKSAASCCFFK